MASKIPALWTYYFSIPFNKNNSLLLLFDLRPNSHTYFCFCSFPTPFHCHRSDCEDFWSLTQESFSTQSCCLLPVIHPSIWKWICRNVFRSLGRTNFLKTLTDLQHFTKLLKIYSDKKKFSILKHNYKKAKEKKNVSFFWYLAKVRDKATLNKILIYVHLF